ncbi:hypothetical protein AAH978_02570 [Streptomyces sp. ZYX-F-203]
MKHAVRAGGRWSRGAGLTTLASLAAVLSLGLAPSAVAVETTGHRVAASDTTGAGGTDCPLGSSRRCESRYDVGASVYLDSGNQTIPTSTVTRVLFDTALYDTDSMFDAADSSLVVNTPGRYLVNANVFWTNLTPATSRIYETFLLINGDSVAFNDQEALPTFATQGVTAVLDLEEGDRITLAVFQNTGSDAVVRIVTGNSDPVAPVLQAELLTPAESEKNPKPTSETADAPATATDSA